MGYLQARSDLQFIKEFKGAVLRLWEFEKKASETLHGSYHPLAGEYQTALQSEASEIAGYQQAREQVARGIYRAIRIAQRLGVVIDIKSIPPMAVGGAIVPVNLFYAILKDTSYGGVTQQWIYDAMNQTVGACEARLDVEFRHLINPLYWLKAILVFSIGIPFMLIEASGFDVSKVEDHFLAKLFKLVEVGVIIYVLIRLGITKDQLQEILIRLFSK